MKANAKDERHYDFLCLHDFERRFFRGMLSLDTHLYLTNLFNETAFRSRIVVATATVALVVSSCWNRYYWCGLHVEHNVGVYDLVSPCGNTLALLS